MPLLVKLSTSLRKQVTGYDPHAGLELEFAPGESAEGLIRRLGLDPERIKIIMVNGRSAAPEQELADGDRVGLFPPVGGG
ncbi:MAG: MoaD/ThiS family protein [Proteobacteria bacterium]|nr:MoaD/ThiS family protein [Pseudomonadota bacterium]MBU1450899.1 MoaD/ThiS family protein [Pseudomonadota bacterium]MBU2468718.1 MoaD/ThiS family protein [Pseudomonadota bacterium]MBU2517176.1 MoaD/ThiS family protein [Pseudomonadota bacterium]